MENLTTRVYECTLAVEAHMICDLLARSGIAARVDGEFLEGASGGLPLGSAISVRVAAANEAEARAVIAEWEKQQPPADTPSAAPAPTPRSRWRSPVWFAVGLAAGIGLSYLSHRLPNFQETVDVDGDGIADETYTYNGHVMSAVGYDTNADGNPDQRWKYDLNGNAESYESDGDFDGKFEWHGEVKRGFLDKLSMDADGDGRPERVQHNSRGRLISEDVYDEAGRRILMREHIKNYRVAAREYDQDGDGIFEKRVEFDRFGEPISNP